LPRRADCPSRPPADIAVATARQSLNPTCTSGDFLKNPAQCCNLNRQIAVLDCKSRPRGLDQRIFGNRCSRPLQKQPKQRNRALAKHDRLGTAKQYLGVRVEAEWPNSCIVVIGRADIIRKHFATFSERIHDLRGRQDHVVAIAAHDEAPKPWRSTVSAKSGHPNAGESKKVTLAGQPMAFLVTGEDTKHTSMFDWTLPAGFSTGLHVHRVQEETFYVLEANASGR